MFGGGNINPPGRGGSHVRKRGTSSNGNQRGRTNQPNARQGVLYGGPLRTQAPQRRTPVVDPFESDEDEPQRFLQNQQHFLNRTFGSQSSLFSDHGQYNRPGSAASFTSGTENTPQRHSRGRPSIRRENFPRTSSSTSGSRENRSREQQQQPNRSRGERGNRNDNHGRGNERYRRNFRRENDENNEHNEHNENNESNENRRSNFQGKRKYPLGFKYLEELLENSPEEVLLKLLENTDALKLLIDKLDLSPDYICLIIRIVVKISDSYFNQQKITILHIIVDESFIKQLIAFVSQLHLHDERDKRRANYFYQSPERFFTDLNVFCETVLKIIPSKGINNLPKILKAAVYELPHLGLSENILVKYEKLQEDLITQIESFHKANEKKIEKLNVVEAEPPDDFRNIPVFPEAHEITNRIVPFLRANIVDGAYRNVEHYLDVQFRLVRNDFVKPLRDGILAYLDPNEKRRPQNIKIYDGVTFLKSEMCKDASNGYLIQLPQTKKGFKVKLENSRLFMFGSLVCFTNDHFKTIIFGRIVDRDIKLLSKGHLVISLHSYTGIDFNSKYTMIESRVYFEPYNHVLTALKVLDENDFPMRQYIVDMVDDNGIPEYYNENEFQCPGKYRIPILNGIIHHHYWPSQKELKLNEAQYEAYKNALSRKFSIIQGPPGTGKTHLGLVVGKSLIHNAKIWHKEDKEAHPLLVICYTNHALDQFLEGLIPTTREIVRIGGQSKNKNLDQFNLRHLRSRSHNRLIQERRGKFEQAARNLKFFYDTLNALRGFNGIVNIKKLLNSLPELTETPFKNMSNEDFIKWLLGGIVQKELNMNVLALNKKIKTNFSDDTSDEDEEIFEELYNMDQDNKGILDDDILDESFYRSGGSTYMITLDQYISNIDNLEADLIRLRDAGDEADPREVLKLSTEYNRVTGEFNYLRESLENAKKITNVHVSYDLLRQLHHPGNIQPADRWKLYLYWMKLYEEQIREEMANPEELYNEAYKEFEEVKMMADIEMLKSKLVIGMTTTSAARLQSVLKALRSKIVIVEEAAEIMEAHIITALTKHCQHIILIGDHQQLRPSTADYLMETKYNLGISLFERMVRNKVQCNVLEIQHRMRPEFAALIVPTIYPVLHNHASVHNFPPVKGVKRNLYFIDHKTPENAENDGSKFNVHEAKYLINLAQYLILNGYKPEDITILCAYSAQLFKMFNERKKFELLRDVRICVLDNYQGEESKIILLSLVRNNKENKVGFLKIDNRICVALSRAREGFYIMGNIDMLSQASPIWVDVKKTLESQNSLGGALPLSCQVHIDKITYIKTVDDFLKVSEGGCDQVCGALLPCEHFCKLQCHVMNRDHAKSHCREQCRKILCEYEHNCPLMCFEECLPCVVLMQRSLPCGHIGQFACSDKELRCLASVSVQLSCGHETKKPCYLPIENVKCPFPCDIRVDSCGHVCVRKCHVDDDPDHLEYKCPKKCERNRPGCMKTAADHPCPKICYQECGECDIVVKKHRSCGHVYQLKCSESVEMMRCEKPCKRKLPCGHKCKRLCSDPCGNCMVTVDKVVPECGHTVKIYCKDEPVRGICGGRCPRRLPCGHQCAEKCKDSCTIKCKGLSRSVCELPCGHFSDIPCFLNTIVEIKCNPNISNYCKIPCTKVLKCTHNCSGSCGECYQGRIHKVCGSKCGVSLICGHICKTPCRAVCPPCVNKCEISCPHSKCGKKCGQPCTKCVEPCTRKCIHQECTNKCDQICSVPPCDKPCDKILRCGHPCIGFCGDPCPPLCRICNLDQLTEFFMGFEDEEDARFILLEDCKHVVESQGMDMWLGQDGGEITTKGCPRCKTPLINTRRFSDYTKELLIDVMEVKKKMMGSLNDNIGHGTIQIVKLNNICDNTSLEGICPKIRILQKIFESQLKPIRQKRIQMLSKLTVDITAAKIQILENICNLYDDIFKKSVTFNPTRKCLDYINFLLERLTVEPERMTEQETEDYEIELKRLRRIFQLDYIFQRLPMAKKSSSYYTNLEGMIYTKGAYNIDEEKTIKRKLDALSEHCGGLDVTESELKDIIKVIGVRSGAWYKCPNGHPYAIGECGGAMEESKCPDCGVKVGGQNHALTSGNAHANIDGSRFAAWSEEANNMENFVFDD